VAANAAAADGSCSGPTTGRARHRTGYSRPIGVLGSRPRKRSFARALSAITAGGLVLRLGYVLTFSDRIQFGLDTTWYELVSGTIVSGDGYVDPGKFYGHGVAVATAFRPPLYPSFLALVSEQIRSSQRTFQVVGCVVGLVTIVLVGLLGRRLVGDAVGLCAAGLAAIYPVFLAVDASVMSETLYVPLIAGCLLAVYSAIDRPAVLRWVLVGGLAGAAALTRGDALVVVAVVVVPSALLAVRLPWRRRVGLAAVSLVVVAAVVAPWVLRNNHRLGTPTLTTLEAGTAIAGTNCPATYSGKMLGSWSFECTQRADQNRVSEVALTNELQREGRRYLFGHASRLPVVVPARVLRLWGLYDPAGQARFEAIESRNVGWQKFSWVVYLPIALLAVYGFVLLRRRRARLFPMMALLLSVTVTGALVYGNQRFRTSAEPVLLVGAAVAIVHLFGKFRGRQPAGVAARG